MESLVEGFKLMIPAITILIFAWSLKGIGDAMGLAEFVGGIVGENASASIFIPVVYLQLRFSCLFQQVPPGGHLRSLFRSQQECLQEIPVWR